MTREAARQFAQSLDREDYVAAEQLLAEACQYEIQGKIIHGPATIIASYRESGDWGSEVFDRVEYESRILECDDKTALIEFKDIISYSGKTHIHTSQQRLFFDNAGKIVKIESVDNPSESERLAAFFQSIGVKRPR